MHSGSLNLANTWIPYGTCNAEIVNKTQKGGPGPPRLTPKSALENALFHTNASVVKTLTAKDL